MNSIVCTSYEEIISKYLRFIFLFGLAFQIVDESSPALANLLEDLTKKKNALVLMHFGMKRTEVSIHRSSSPAAIMLASNNSQVSCLVLTEI